MNLKHNGIRSEDFIIYLQAVVQMLMVLHNCMVVFRKCSFLEELNMQ